MERSLTSAFIATSLREQDKEVNDWFTSIFRSLRIEPFFGDEPETEEIPSKIRRMIGEHPNFIAILVKRDQIKEDKWRPPEWVNNEIGIAYAYERNIAVFVEEGVDTQGLVPYIGGYIRFNREKLLDTMAPIISLLISLFDTQDKSISFQRLLSIQGFLTALSSLNDHFERIKALKEVKRQVEEEQIKLISISKKGEGRTPILTGGKNSSLFLGVRFDVLRELRVDDDIIMHEKVASLKVIDIQKEMSQCKFEEICETDFFDFLEGSMDGIHTVPDNKLAVHMFAGTDHLDVESTEDLLGILKPIIDGCRAEVRRFQGEIKFGY